MGGHSAPFKVHDPKDNYRGLSMGELVASWTNWLMSDRSEYGLMDNIFFMRGNVGYYQDLQKSYERVRENAETSYEGTDVLIPVICTMYNIGDYYEGSKIQDEVGLRRALRKTFTAGRHRWARYKYAARYDASFDAASSESIVSELKNFYVESGLFKLMVSDRSSLREKLEDPVDPGVYDAVTGGLFILLKDLKAGYYRIRFGGIGQGVYNTDSIYDLLIADKPPQTLAGLASIPNIPPSRSDLGI